MRRIRFWQVSLTVFWCWFALAPPCVAELLPTQLYDTKTKTATTSTPVTDSVIWTPASGYKIVLQGCLITSSASDQIELESSDVDVIPPYVFQSYGTEMVSGGGAPIWVGAVDATLAWTTTTSATASILCWGYEVTP